MKKLLLSLSFILSIGASEAQNLLSENFDVFPATWTKINQSAPLGTNLWNSASAAVTPYFLGGAFNGTTDTSYAYANFNSTTGTGTISNWLITPIVSLQNGDVISFYSRKGLSGGATVYPDRVEMRISYEGGFTNEPSTGSADIGDYSTLALSINPALNTTSYPTSWTQYSYTVSGLPLDTDSKIAFRYFVTLGGPSGSNSDYVAIDAFSVDRPLSTSSFFASNFAVSPNPANTVVNISNKNNSTLNQIQLTDLNGRIVKTIKANGVSSIQINIADLNTGVYFLKISSDKGVGTTKIIKS